MAMNRSLWLVTGMVLMALGAAAGGVYAADARGPGDFEVTAPDGRRILLREDGRWRYIDPKGAAAEAEKKADSESEGGDRQAQEKEKPKKDVGEVVLSVERKLDGNRICRFALKLVNNLKFEVRSFVPEFKAYRTSGVVYDTVFGAFQFIRPGDNQVREIRFEGIGCADITRLQVTGGDRCEIGDLDRFSPVKGVCLSYVRVVESDLVRFDK